MFKWTMQICGKSVACPHYTWNLVMLIPSNVSCFFPVFDWKTVCPIPAKDSIVVRSILRPYTEERIVYVLEHGSLVFYGICLVEWKGMARIKKVQGGSK